MSEGIKREPPERAEADWLAQLWQRIREHKMVQWSVAYVALAYGIQHGVVLTSESLDWPHAVARVTMILLALGLPLVLTLAWYHGERASRRVSGPELTIISILLVIGSLFFYVFVQPSEQIAATPPAVKEAGVAAARNASLSPATAISIAVLPFANLSGDSSQDFFSDGMTEEISGALAKIPDLRVVARSSSFQFKGKNEDARAMGQALGATHLIEGSVRKVGNRVRISAELVKADDGLRVWAENYDRDLTDVFEIQENIARSIAASLRMPLGLKTGERLVNNRTGDLEAYEDFLRIRAVGAQARALPPRVALPLLESAVARDPNFAPAWATLADLYDAAATVSSRQSGSLDEVRRAVRSWQDKAESAARKAIALDPGLATGYGGLGKVQYRRAKWAEAEKLFQQALALDADDPPTLQFYSNMLASVGRLKDASPFRERLTKLEPFIPIYNWMSGRLLYLGGQNRRAIGVLEAIPPSTNSYNRNYSLAEAYAAEGQYAKAADTLLLINTQVPHSAVEDAATLLRTAPGKTAKPEKLPALQADLNFVYAHVGATDRVLEYPERSLQLGQIVTSISALWAPNYAPLRKTERFKKLMRDAGLVDYWKVRGWPDLCDPTTGDDFVCK